jgi:hypothetical protein
VGEFTVERSGVSVVRRAGLGEARQRPIPSQKRRRRDGFNDQVIAIEYAHFAVLFVAQR